MTILRQSLVLLLVLLSGSCVRAPGSVSRTPFGSDRIAFVHAAVIPMDEERVLRDYTVIVARGTIVEMGPSSVVPVPGDAVRIDATGRYLMPALCDMHVHLVGGPWNSWLRPDARDSLPYERFLLPYVANGVTTVQALWATPEDIILRERISRGELLGPRLILARMIDGPDKAWPPPLSAWVSSATEAREAVRRAKEEGYDKVKVYSFLSRESYDAIVATARELGMDVIGHVPMSLSVEYVLAAGQTLIAHSEEVAKHAGGNYDAERIDAFASRMAEANVWMMPTLVTSRSLVELFDDSERLLGRPEAAYFRHPLEAAFWSFLVEKIYGPVPPEARRGIRDDYERFQRPLTRAFHQKGGRMLAGSDAPLPGLVPGFALHRELRELVDVGLTPFEALRTATLNPFEYLGESDRAGTVQVGKQTDLLLLDENPLEDISAASRIAGVLVRGRWIGAAEIQKRMQALTASSEGSDR